jgi:hypothetical protein
VVLTAEVVAEAPVTALEPPVHAEALRMTAPASIATRPRLAGLITLPGPTRRGQPAACIRTARLTARPAMPIGGAGPERSVVPGS